MLKDEPEFEWDDYKNLENQIKHGVSFLEATHAFLDPKHIIMRDDSHSHNEERYFCLGLNKKQTNILTVRFTFRKKKLRIIGAGYWRKGRRLYEQENQIH